jgi:hypothetical protein
MGRKAHRSHPQVGYYKVQGSAVEDRASTRSAKQALGRQEARLLRRAGRKTRLGPPPIEQRTPERPPAPPVTAGRRKQEVPRVDVIDAEIQEVRKRPHRGSLVLRAADLALNAADHALALARSAVELLWQRYERRHPA